MPSETPLLPFDAVIQAALALDDALDHGLFPQARHQTRVVALRADGAGHPQIAACAHALREILERSIRPAPETWTAAREDLHRAIDDALM